MAQRSAKIEQRERRETEQEDEDYGRVDEEEIEQHFEAGLSADQADRAKSDNDPRNNVDSSSSDDGPA